MKIDCEKAKEIILTSGAPYSPEMKAHMVKCEDCKALADEWSALKDARPTSRRNIPKSLDFSIVSEAEVFVKSRAEHSRAVFRWLSFISAAACVALFALAVFTVLKDKSAKTTGASRIIASSNLKQADSPEIAWDEVSFYSETSNLRDEVELYIADMRNNDQDDIPPGNGEGNFIVNIEIPEFLT
jgi:hypothetical protein